MDLIELKLDLGLSELSGVFSFEKPSGALPVTACSPDLFAITHLANHLSIFYRKTKAAHFAGTDAFDGFGTDAAVKSGLSIGEGDEEAIGDFTDEIGIAIDSARSADFLGHKQVSDRNQSLYGIGGSWRRNLGR
jgi:hypothetical protein